MTEVHCPYLHMNIHIKKPTEFIKQLLELVSKVSKVTEYKVNKQKSIILRGPKSSSVFFHKMALVALSHL